MVLSLALAFGYARLQSAYREGGAADPVTSAIRAALLPPSQWVWRGWDSAGAWMQSLGQGARLAEDVRRLRAERDEAFRRVREAQMTEKRLNAYLAAKDYQPRPPYTEVAGQVITVFPASSRIALNVGSNQKVRPNLAVVDPRGLVGIVESVEPDRCQAVLITAAGPKLDAVVLREGEPVGFITGESPRSLLLELREKTPLEPGSVVATAGLGGNMPAGIPIGEILEVSETPETGFYPTAKVLPFLRLGVLKDVKVLVP